MTGLALLFWKGGATLPETIVAVAALAAAIIFLYTKVLRPIVKAVMKAADMADTLGEIAQEFKHNHGTSLRDVIDDMNHNVGIATLGMAKLEQLHGDLANRVTAVEQSLVGQTKTIVDKIEEHQGGEDG